MAAELTSEDILNYQRQIAKSGMFYHPIPNRMNPNIDEVYNLFFHLWYARQFGLLKSLLRTLTKKKQSEYATLLINSYPFNFQVDNSENLLSALEFLLTIGGEPDQRTINRVNYLKKRIDSGNMPMASKGLIKKLDDVLREIEMQKRLNVARLNKKLSENSESDPFKDPLSNVLTFLFKSKKSVKTKKSVKKTKKSVKKLRIRKINML